MDATELKRIIRNYYQFLYVNQSENQDDNERFLQNSIMKKKPKQINNQDGDRISNKDPYKNERTRTKQKLFLLNFTSIIKMIA